MRRSVFVALWLAGTVAASSLAFAAVAMVGDVAAQPAPILAPVDVGEAPGEIELAEGTVAVDCPEQDAATLMWAQPNGGAAVKTLASGPPRVVVEFVSDDEVTRVRVDCVDGVPTPAVTTTDLDEEGEEPSDASTPDVDDDDLPPSTVSTPPPTSSTAASTSTTEDDDHEDHEDEDHSTSTTEHEDDEDGSSATTEPGDD
jgi:hypothetical protein